MTVNSDKRIATPGTPHARTRVKLLGDWCPPEQLCAEWDRMSQGGCGWNDIEVTSSDHDIDFYVIINRPWPGEHFVAERTIVFQMEPWCPEPQQHWGVKTWGEWSRPDPAKFLQVRDHRHHVNNAFWQLRSTYEELRTRPIAKTRVLASICSGKYFDPGHIKRVDFLKFIEAKNDDVVRVELYAHDNPLGFGQWVGPHPPGEKDAALLPYRYFFAAENNQEHNFITEKLWEPLLTETLCFYWGAPNASDYVDARAYIALDLDDFEQAFRTMKTAILDDEWGKRIDVIRREKRKVLEHYQFFPTLERILRHELRLPAHPDDDTLRYHRYFGDALDETLRNACFIHSYTRNGDTSILTGLLDALSDAGLLPHLNRVYIFNVGDEATLPARFARGHANLRLVNHSPDASRGEVPTLELMRAFARRHPDASVLYLHTKGASYEGARAEIDDWRRMLLHFLVERHDEARAALKANDVAGCNLVTAPRPHFSGNFWWARADYLSTLPPLASDDRHAAEWWPLSRAGVRALSLHDSGVDHYDERYPRERYVSTSETGTAPVAAVVHVGSLPAGLPRPRICLCMIVKDEAHIVHETLATVAPHIGYWVIVDTGSTDATIAAICEYFAQAGVPGELHRRAWVDFGSNRSEALALARGKADYLWMIDADDLVVGEIDLSELALDSYLLRYGSDFRYWRKQLFAGDLRWRYEGVLHEFPVCDDAGNSEGRLEGEYYIDSRRLGNRSRAVDKYHRDAMILLTAVQANPDDARSVFYLAQSYRDAGDPAQALVYYSRRAAMGGWHEEVFYSQMQRAICMQRLDAPWEQVLAAYLECWQAHPSRAEPLYEIARHYRLSDQFELAQLFASRARAIPYPADVTLFVSADIYDWRIADELAIAAYYCRDYRQSFALNVELLQGAALPELERDRITANRDFALSHFQDEAPAYPEVLAQRLAEEFARGPRAAPQLTLTITTCRRLELFEKTIDSFLACCIDHDRIDRWICIDDESSDADRKRMRERYPFFEFIFKNVEDKGHARSMNRLLDEVASEYWLHLEDDWQFVVRERYVERALAVLDDDASIAQLLFNRNYGETPACRSIAGGTLRHTRRDGQRYRAHDYIEAGTAAYDAFFAAAPPGTVSNLWWPHYSLRPSLLRRSALRGLGHYEAANAHFELDYARRYTAHGLRSAFLDGIHALHIGRLTTERGSDRTNAYTLNDEPQFANAATPLDRRRIRIQLVADGSSPAALRERWTRQSQVDGRWDEIEIVGDDDAIDYWAVLGHPGKTDASRPNDRSIVVESDGDGARDISGLDPRDFVQLRTAARYLSNAGWRLGMSHAQLGGEPNVKTRQLSSVVHAGASDETGARETDFLRRLDATGLDVDIYGPEALRDLRNYGGTLPVNDTSAGVLPYRYTVAIEDRFEVNRIGAGLVDAILGECLCFYWGCPNLEEYIDPAAFIRLPIDDEQLSRAIIERAIADDEHAKRIAVIRAEKRRILDEYQLLPTLARVIRGHALSERLAIRVLNLDRRPDRWHSFQERMLRVVNPAFASRCERFAAVDGTALVMTPEITHLFRGNDFDFRRGIVGCALSHLELWREAARMDDGAGALIFEDDAALCHDFRGQLVEVCGELDAMRGDYDVVLLGYLFWDRPEASLLADTHMAARLRPMDWSNYLGGTFGYIVSPRGARRLLSLVESDGIQNGIDWFIMKKGAQLKALQCAPHLVASPLAVPGSATDSDIQHDMTPVAEKRGITALSEPSASAQSPG